MASLASEIKESYAELVGSEAVSNKFTQAVNLALQGDEESMTKIVVRIERIGKGRFGQRLASKIGKHEPPKYIGEAIDHIVKTVQESLA